MYVPLLCLILEGRVPQAQAQKLAQTSGVEDANKAKAPSPETSRRTFVMLGGQ